MADEKAPLVSVVDVEPFPSYNDEDTPIDIANLKYYADDNVYVALSLPSTPACADFTESQDESYPTEPRNPCLRSFRVFILLTLSIAFMVIASHGIWSVYLPVGSNANGISDGRRYRAPCHGVRASKMAKLEMVRMAKIHGSSSAMEQADALTDF